MPGLRGGGLSGRKVDVKGQHRDPCRDGNVLCLCCISVNILVVIVYYSFARITIEISWEKDTIILCVLLLSSAYESTIISKEKIFN